MYKKYKLGLSTNGVSHGTPDGSTFGRLRDGSGSYGDRLIEEKVRRCWQETEEQCIDGERGHSGQEQEEEEEEDTGGWRTVRVFVSSTFTDFHSERETLVKKVFPALREWCEDYQLHLVECDLRWGVPKDSTTGATLIACMEEIDRCYHDNDGEPFFLGMLGERYGWIPDFETIPEEIRSRYGWVPGVSVTHMEILHGAYRQGNPSAVFFLRDPGYVSDLPSRYVHRFVDTSPLSVQQLKMLKEKLQEKFPVQLVKYRCQVAGVDASTGREKVQISGLEEFSEKALAFLKSAIRRRYCDSERSVTALTVEEQETRLHLAVAESKARLVIGRDRELTTLLDFARGDIASLQLWSPSGQTEGNTGGGDVSSPEGKDGENKGSSCPLLWVQGAAGMGKSAVMAKTARVLQQAGTHVMYHHVGCTVSSLSRDNVTARVVSSLTAQLEGDESQAQSQAASDVLPTERLKQILEKYALTNKCAVLIIDGIDELTESSVSGDVSWLASLVSDNVRCIVSVRSSHLPIVTGLKRLNCHQVELAALNVDNCRLLAEHYFSVYNKRLDEVQLDQLTQHSGATTPLWLTVACEELRVFGDFATLTSHIASLPPELDGLLAGVLHRLLREDDTGLMRQVLCVLYVCPAGCPEEHIRQVLGDGQTDMPLLSWVTLRRYLRPFTRMTSHLATRTVRVQFFHDSMRQAVRHNILPDSSDEKQWHHLLGEYYERRCKDNAFLTEDLPIHLLAAGHTQRLLDFYRKDVRAMRVPAYYKRLYLNKLRCRETISPHSAVTGTKPLRLCLFCAHKTSVFGRAPWQAKDACCVCGELAGGMGKEAQLCRRHAPFTAPGVARCGGCGHSVMGAMRPKMTPAVVCNFCHLGGAWSRCCEFVTNSS